MSSYETTAIGKKSKEGNYEKFVVGRVRTSDFDVDIDIKYCGLCHTDLHLVTFSPFLCTIISTYILTSLNINFENHVVIWIKIVCDEIICS